MAEKTEQPPKWLEQIINHLEEKPYKYRNLIKRSFALAPIGLNAVEGYCFGLDFLFSEGLCPEQMESDLQRYRIIEDVAQSESLDLIGKEGSAKAVLYRKDLPLNTLAIGYFGKQPGLQEVDKVFSAYDNIQVKLKT